jgi:hypothetical protein
MSDDVRFAKCKLIYHFVLSKFEIKCLPSKIFDKKHIWQISISKTELLFEVLNHAINLCENIIKVHLLIFGKAMYIPHGFYLELLLDYLEYHTIINYEPFNNMMCYLRVNVILTEAMTMFNFCSSTFNYNFEVVRY